MKKQGKKFVLAGLVLLAVTGLLAMAGCENGSGSAGGNLADAKLVIRESVDAMEQMMSESPTGQSPQTSQRLSSVLPNTAFGEKELLDITIGFACMNMYMAEYLVENDVIDFDTTYTDNPDDTTKVSFHMERMEDGTIKMLQDMAGVVVSLYFDYNYELMEPNGAVCVQFDEGLACVSTFDYQTEEAVLLGFRVGPDKFSTLWSALEEKSFGFDKLVEDEVLLYQVGKMNVDNGKVSNLVAYMYDSKSSDGGIADIVEEEVAAFFNQVYSQVKDFLAVRDELDTSGAVQRTFYAELYTYAYGKVEELLGE